jgi:hypothetical protein
MSPNEQNEQKPVAKRKAGNNIYTAMLAATTCAVIATAIFVAAQCYFQYGTILGM